MPREEAGNFVQRALFDKDVLDVAAVLLPAGAEKFAAKKLFDTYHPEVVVITQGKRGGIVYDGELTSYGIIDTPVVDSNGAGDVFHGAFAFAMTQGWDYRKCAMFASATSSLKCTRVGARAAVPTYDEVINILKENGYNEF